MKRTITLLVSAAAALVAAAVGSAATAGGYLPGYGTKSVAPGPASALVGVGSSRFGRILVDGRGHTLYLFERDKRTASTCYGACATYWPPLTTTAKPQAGRRIMAGKLGTTKRRDGRLEVTYNGHPLYTFVADTKRGDTKGQDLNQFGGGWYVLSTKGVKVERGS
jgi:predicted lipoprotein with Yx(FWY)xxD motif